MDRSANRVLKMPLMNEMKLFIRQDARMRPPPVIHVMINGAAELDLRLIEQIFPGKLGRY